MHVLFLIPLLGSPQSMTAEDLYARVQSVVGAPRMKEDLLLTGTSERLDVKGTYSARIASDGRYSVLVKSAIGQKVGFDGKRTWDADYTGATRVLAFGEEDQERVVSSVLTGKWMDRKSIASLSMPFAQAGMQGYTLNLKLKGSEIEQAVEVDPQSNLPKAIRFNTPGGKVTVTLGKWTQAGDRKVPFEISTSVGDVSDKVFIDRWSAELNQPDAFDMPEWKPSDVSFDRGVDGKIPTQRLRSGHIVVHPRVNGKDIGWFILDSGAGAMCIDKEAANSLGLGKVGAVQAVGVGGVVKVPWRPAREFTLGPATYKNFLFLELELAQIGKMLGLPIGGIIGYDVFRRSVVEMDVKKPQVVLSAPSAYKLGKGNWQTIRFDGGNIGIEAEFEGNRKGWFRLDTGAAGTVSFHTPFVERFKLLENREVEKTQEGGVGGMQEARRGKIDYFILAGHRFEKPVAGFSISKVGAFNNRWLVGNIGQNFMDPFVLVFDYSNARMAFVPRPSSTQQP